MALISVIIPYFNNQDSIEETLNSVLNQTYKNFEIIIINDGSENVAVDFLNSIQNTYKFNLITQKNSGPSSARNNGALNANGEYLLFLDADDTIHKTYLQKCLDCFTRNSNLQLVNSKAMFFGARYESWQLPELELLSFLRNNCIHISCLIKKEVFVNLGMFDTNISYAEDWELWLRFIKTYGTDCYYRIPEELFFYRKHHEKNSLTDKLNTNNYAESCRAYIYKKHYDFYTEHKLDLLTLYDAVDQAKRYKYKYRNIWYKKLFK